MLFDGDLILRLYQKDDREALARLADNFNVSRYLTDRFPNPYGLADADCWLARVGAEDAPHNLAIEWQGQFIGCIGLTPLDDVYRRTAEIGYWLGEAYWGRGLAAKAVAMMLKYTFARLNFLRIQALVFAENKNSARVLEKNNFVFEATLRKHVTKHGRTQDAMLYARLCD